MRGDLEGNEVDFSKVKIFIRKSPTGKSASWTQSVSLVQKNFLKRTIEYLFSNLKIYIQKYKKDSLGSTSFFSTV